MLLNGRQSATAASLHSERQGARGAFGRIAAALKSARGALLWFAFCSSVIVLVAAGGLLIWKQRTNATIRDLRAGKDIAVNAVTASPQLLEARASYLLARDRIDEAQPLLDQAALRGDVAVNVRMLQNMANARLRAAIAAIEKGNFDKAIPLVALAKGEYRSALRHEPRNWDAKYNLDVAMRLVRDLPRAEGEEEAEPEQAPSKLWTDLPGVPKGLP
jgi:mxaK protein